MFKPTPKSLVEIATVNALHVEWRLHVESLLFLPLFFQTCPIIF